MSSDSFSHFRSPVKSLLGNESLYDTKKEVKFMKCDPDLLNTSKPITE